MRKVLVLLGLVVLTTSFMATSASAATWTRLSINGLGSADLLNDVTVVPGTHDAYAVGGEQAPTTAGEVEFWDGSSWTATPVGSGELDGVSAASASDVWAVGSGEGQQAWHFDGSKWTNVPVPTGDALRDVLVTKGAVWAVGSTATAGGMQAVILRWNGTSWSTSTPIPATTDSQLFGITQVPGSQTLWAVGDVGSFNRRPLAVRFNGTSWHRVTTPSDEADAVLHGVAASSDSQVFAVGHVFSADPLILRWDGTAWTSVPVSFSQEFTDVVRVPGSTHFWAVGYLSLESSPVTDLVAFFNGSHWSSVTTPDENCDELLGVAATAGSHVFVVGASGQTDAVGCTQPPGTTTRDLILRR